MWPSRQELSAPTHPLHIGALVSTHSIWTVDELVTTWQTRYQKWEDKQVLATCKLEHRLTSGPWHGEGDHYKCEKANYSPSVPMTLIKVSTTSFPHPRECPRQRIGDLDSQHDLASRLPRITGWSRFQLGAKSDVCQPMITYQLYRAGDCGPNLAHCLLAVGAQHLHSQIHQRILQCFIRLQGILSHEQLSIVQPAKILSMVNTHRHRHRHLSVVWQWWLGCQVGAGRVRGHPHMWMISCRVEVRVIEKL